MSPSLLSTTLITGHSLTRWDYCREREDTVLEQSIQDAAARELAEAYETHAHSAMQVVETVKRAAVRDDDEG